MTSTSFQAIACNFWQTVNKASKDACYTCHLKLGNNVRTSGLHKTILNLENFERPQCDEAYFKEISILQTND